MNNRFVFELIAVLLVSFTADANPFKDVSPSHWAYDAVNKLVARGIVDGYPDGTFKGGQSASRYDLAMTTANMLVAVERMANNLHSNEAISRAELDTLESLAMEFSDELALIGIKITALEDDMRVVQHDVEELKADTQEIMRYIERGGDKMVKISGDMLVRHSNMNRHNDDFNDNTLTESQIRLRFTFDFDENVQAVARWRVFSRNAPVANSPGASMPTTRRQGVYGRDGIGNITPADSFIDTAYLQITDFPSIGGDFFFGRAYYGAGHRMLLNNFIDAVRYTRNMGEVKGLFQYVYDRHQGSYKDNVAGVDHRGLWNATFTTTSNNHDMYLSYYHQSEPNLASRRGFIKDFTTTPVTTVPTFTLGNQIIGNQESDRRYDVEFGSKGPFGNSENWSYDLGVVYSNYELDVVNDPAFNLINPVMQGWMGHVALKYDSNCEWTAQVAYTTADDESVGAYTIAASDFRYVNGPETPYEDIARGNTWFNNGLLNMNLLKIEAEYKPKNSRHYFRLSGNLLSENQDEVSNDLARWAHAAETGYNSNVVGAPDVAAGNDKQDTAYDRWNNFGISEAKATVLTFEHRYQLSKNTRLRTGYTRFDFDGQARRSIAGSLGEAGRGLFNSDFDYNFIWTELHSTF